jgi:hypothetical protein
MEEAILKTLKKWGQSTNQWDGVWWGYDSLLDELNVLGVKTNLKDLKAKMKELKIKGVVEIRHTSNDESRVAGSGYFLTETLINQ